jgi:hypothetical protein
MWRTKCSASMNYKRACLYDAAIEGNVAAVPIRWNDVEQRGTLQCHTDCPLPLLLRTTVEAVCTLSRHWSIKWTGKRRKDEEAWEERKRNVISVLCWRSLPFSFPWPLSACTAYIALVRTCTLPGIRVTLRDALLCLTYLRAIRNAWAVTLSE